VAVALNIKDRPAIISEATDLLGQTRQNFFRTTLEYTIPALIIAKQRSAIDFIATVVEQKPSRIMYDYMRPILSRIFLTPGATDQGLRLVASIISPTNDPNAIVSVTPASMITSASVHFAADLVAELGDEDRAVREIALKAIQRAQSYQTGEAVSSEIDQFLKPLMIGVLQQLSETIFDMHGKKPLEYKRKIVRSFGALFKRNGGAMAGYSPQVSRLALRLQSSGLTSRSWPPFKARWPIQSCAWIR
jgi:serine/threonine-protein kinase ATR